MLNIKALGILMKITSRLDLTPVIEKLKNLDIFSEVKNTDEAKQQLTREKMGEVAAEVINALLPQLDSVSEFLAELISAYKNVSVEEAEQLDAIAVIEEIMHDEGIVSFFKRALQKKVEPKS